MGLSTLSFVNQRKESSFGATKTKYPKRTNLGFIGRQVCCSQNLQGAWLWLLLSSSTPVCITRGIFGGICIFAVDIWGYLRDAWSGPPRCRGRELRVYSINCSLKVSSLTPPSMTRNAGQALLLDSFGALGLERLSFLIQKMRRMRPN